MASALLTGLVKQGQAPSSLFAYDLNSTRLKGLRSQLKIQICKNPVELVQKSQILILATKPQDLKGALQTLRPYFRKHLVISIAAGIDLWTLSRLLPSCKLVRSMPNNPALIGEGITALFSKHKLKRFEKNIIETVFKGCGEALWVQQEDQLDAVTGLSGSGPAYVYQFVQALTQAGMAQGLSEKVAYPLVLKTLIGSALTLLKTGKKPAELIPWVTSKKGTTLAGLSILKKKGFDKIIQQTVAAATLRAKEIKKEIKNKCIL